MPGFIDVRCRKCKRKIGWFGEIADQPACPHCGAPPPSRQELEAMERELDKARQEVLRDMEKKDG